MHTLGRHLQVGYIVLAGVVPGCWRKDRIKTILPGYVALMQPGATLAGPIPLKHLSR